MKNLLFIAALLLTGYFGFSQQVYVKGYYRSNGTYVQPHYRTAPNHTVNDNWSTVGNVNPYTGKAGTKPRQGSYTPSKTYKTRVKPVYSKAYNYPKAYQTKVAPVNTYFDHDKYKVSNEEARKYYSNSPITKLMGNVFYR